MAQTNGRRVRMNRSGQILVVLLVFVLHRSQALIDHALPECARPGFNVGFKSGGALGGIGAAAYSGLLSTCPGMLPAVVGSGASIALPGLMIGGPLAPMAAMLATGVVGGAMLGGATGSVISCREVGVQNDTHYMVQYKPEHHSTGYGLEMAKDGRYRPMHRYNHHVHPRPDPVFDTHDYTPLKPLKRPPRHPYDFQNYFYDSDDLLPAAHPYYGDPYMADWNYVAQGPRRPRYQVPRHRYRDLQTLEDTFTHAPRPDFQPSRPIPAPYQPESARSIPTHGTNFTRLSVIQTVKGDERNPKFESGFVPVNVAPARPMNSDHEAEEIISHPLPVILTPTFKPQSTAEVDELLRDNQRYITAIMEQHLHHQAIEETASPLEEDFSRPIHQYVPPPQFVAEPLPALAELHELNDLKRMAAVERYYSIQPSLFHKMKYARRPNLAGLSGRSFRAHNPSSHTKWMAELTRKASGHKKRQRSRNFPYYGGNNRKMLFANTQDSSRERAQLVAWLRSPRRFDANGMLAPMDESRPAVPLLAPIPRGFYSREVDALRAMHQHQGKSSRWAERRHDNSLMLGHPEGSPRGAASTWAEDIPASVVREFGAKHGRRQHPQPERDGERGAKTRQGKVSYERESFQPSPRDPIRHY